MYVLLLLLGGAVGRDLPGINAPGRPAFLEESPFHSTRFLLSKRQGAGRNPLLTIDEENLYIPLPPPGHPLRTRREFRDLSAAEWDVFQDAVHLLRDCGHLEPIARVHRKVTRYAHNTPEFLPWHRMFLLYFEHLLRTVSGVDSLTVPYWDWTIDAEHPSRSPIFDARHWGLRKCFYVLEPSPHCVKRTPYELDPFYGKEKMRALIELDASYDRFRKILELVPHAIVHLGVGGDDGDMTYMQSTNDPLFWHHHSYVDYLWEIRMQREMEKGRLSGENLYEKDTDLGSVLHPFNLTIGDVLDLARIGIMYEPPREGALGSEPEPNNISPSYIKIHHYNEEDVRSSERALRGDSASRPPMSALLL